MLLCFYAVTERHSKSSLLALTKTLCANNASRQQYYKHIRTAHNAPHILHIGNKPIHREMAPYGEAPTTHTNQITTLK